MANTLGIRRRDDDAIKTKRLKKDLLAALESTLGVITPACKIVGCNRATYYNFYNSDPAFKAAADEIGNVAIDHAESSLFQQISNGDAAPTIFYLKTKAKHRGYIERTEIETNPETKHQVAKLFALLLIALQDRSKSPVEQVASAVEGYCRLKGYDPAEIASLVQAEATAMSQVQLIG